LSGLQHYRRYRSQVACFPHELPASSVSEQDIKEVLSSGARGVLKKPLSIDDLIEAVQRFRQNGDNLR
jgi:DNA-binding NarL/FixJ family response regulator